MGLIECMRDWTTALGWACKQSMLGGEAMWPKRVRTYGSHCIACVRTAFRTHVSTFEHTSATAATPHSLGHDLLAHAWPPKLAAMGCVGSVSYDVPLFYLARGRDETM